MNSKLVKRVVALALSFTLALCLFAPIVVSAADGVMVFEIGSTSYTLNGQRGIMEAAPFIADDRTMVPLRLIAEAMGADVGFDAGVVTITRGSDVATLTVGTPLPGGMGTPVIREDRTFVPVRFVAETLGAEDVGFNAGVITITLPGGTVPAPQPQPEPEPPAPAPEGATGIAVSSTVWGDTGSGVNIQLGSGRDSWPFADGDADYRAFVPQAGTTYRLSFNVTSTGAAGWRVRWMTTGISEYPSYTAGDSAIVNDHSVAPGVAATVIPAHFNDGFSSGGTYTLVVDITLDGSETLNGLIGNITLRGTAGSTDWYTNWVTIERLSGGPGSAVAESLASWGR
jgi:hypothetical protein